MNKGRQVPDGGKNRDNGACNLSIKEPFNSEKVKNIMGSEDWKKIRKDYLTNVCQTGALIIVNLGS